MSETVGGRRLRAPRASGGTLIEPPLSSAGEMLASAVERRSASTYDLQGRTLPELAALARAELLAAATAYTRRYRDIEVPRSPAALFLAGHQPEIFHPGVWFKNFALSSLGEHFRAAAVNLVIDSDTIKTASLRVPTGTVRDARFARVDFDRGTAEIPHEERRVQDWQVLQTFGERCASTISSLVPNPLVQDYWPRVIARAKETLTLGEAIAQARHQLEGEWGQTTLELPQSHVCCLESFRWFTVHVLANLPRFWEVYNSAVLEYRRANNVRSIAHPVPELATDDDWLEAPFWIWTADDPQRRRAFVREANDRLEITDRRDVRFALNVTADKEAITAVAELAEVACRGIKLRTRALGTTLLARLILGDVFLHGIGGAKYDQLTDRLIERFFGVQPPEFFAVSASLHLPIQREVVTAADARQIDIALRELEFHPERHVRLEQQNGHAQQISDLTQQKQRWIQTPVTMENARLRARAIRGINALLQPWLEPRRSEILARRIELAESLRREGVFSSREYAFCLYPEQDLRSLMSAAPASLARE